MHQSSPFLSIVQKRGPSQRLWQKGSKALIAEPWEPQRTLKSTKSTQKDNNNNPTRSIQKDKTSPPWWHGYLCIRWHHHVFNKELHAHMHQLAASHQVAIHRVRCYGYALRLLLNHHTRTSYSHLTQQLRVGSGHVEGSAPDGWTWLGKIYRNSTLLWRMQRGWHGITTNGKHWWIARLYAWRCLWDD